jgi:hypothetical protein
MPAKSNFAPTMMSFLVWYFRSLDPEFVSALCGTRTLEEAATQVYEDIIGKVRGNRDPLSAVMAADYGAIMDRIAALHLRTRHGESAVSEEAVAM